MNISRYLGKNKHFAQLKGQYKEIVYLCFCPLRPGLIVALILYVLLSTALSCTMLYQILRSSFHRQFS